MSQTAELSPLSTGDTTRLFVRETDGDLVIESQFGRALAWRRAGEWSYIGDYLDDAEMIALFERTLEANRLFPVSVAQGSK